MLIYSMLACLEKVSLKTCFGPELNLKLKFKFKPACPFLLEEHAS